MILAAVTGAGKIRSANFYARMTMQRGASGAGVNLVTAAIGQAGKRARGHAGKRARGCGGRQVRRLPGAARPARGGQNWMNCICVPASSMTSPFFRCTESPVNGVPLIAGRCVPSTWAIT